MIIYRVPKDVQASKLHNRPVLSTQEGGLIAIDTTMLALWEYADGKDLSEILVNYQIHEANSDMIRAGLACLAEAGLLNRSQESKGYTPTYRIG